MLGTVIHDRFEIIRQVGEGAMGRVFLTSDLQQDRDVAIKVVNAHHIENPAERRHFQLRLEREVAILKRLDHPNIVSLYADGTFENCPFLVMEYVDGETLAAMSRREALSQQTVCRLVGQVAAALDYAHSMDVVHRDVKPANVLVTAEGSAKLLDFGIAKACTMGFTSLTRSAEWVGTPHYSSPEQITNQTVTAATDIYALAVMSHQLLTGHLPFKSRHVSELLFEIVRGQPAFMWSKLPATLDFGALNRLFMRALAKEPECRHERAMDFADELRAVLTSDGQVPASREQTQKTRRFNLKLPWNRS